MPADVPMEGPLLKGVRAPPFKVACATAWGLWISGTFGLFMHILHGHHEVRSRPGGAQHEVVLITLAFPLSAMLLMILIIPLFGERRSCNPGLAVSLTHTIFDRRPPGPTPVSVFDHAAFTSLSMLRPDHYGRCVPCAFP